MKRTRLFAATAILAIAATVVAACGTSTDAGDATTSSSNKTSASGSADGGSTDSAGGAADLAGDTKKDLTIPIASGWDEVVAVSNLFKYVLEQHGYTVDLPTLDVAPIFDGVATGEYDIFFDTWLPNTHKDYWQQYQDRVVDLGVWYDKAPLTIAVPEYMDIDSLADLKAIGDQVDHTITGIDPGAGLSRVTKEDMMPAYGLDDWTLKLSSTAAMLAELKTAIDNKEPIVVTLWRPHWAYSAFPIKDLDDPQGAMGAPDEIHTIASNDFVAANPGLTALLKQFRMDADALGDLENVVLQEHQDDPQAGVEAWVKANPDFVSTLLG
jgi:glycine betaine/proline transport system substrate-binding protein